MLAPEIQSLLDWSTSVADRYEGLSQAELRPLLRDELDAELTRRGAVVEEVANVANDRVAVAGGEIDVRVFTPHSPPPRPAFIHLHGGGFVFGTIHSLVNEVKCAHLCRTADCAVVTVEYRLAPEHRFPTAPEDCYAALHWTVENAPRLGIDPTRIAIGGESAGGNLAAAVALIARDRKGPALALQVLEVPVTDISDSTNDHPSVALYGEGYGLDRADMDAFAAAYLADSADGSRPYASPLLASDLSGLTPAHVLTVEYDILRDAGEAYARRLAAAGVPTTHRRLAGMTHGAGALWQEWPPAREWMDNVTAALRQALHGAAPLEAAPSLSR
jgi:acetyl esterase/lipase